MGFYPGLADRLLIVSRGQVHTSIPIKPREGSFSTSRKNHQTNHGFQPLKQGVKRCWASPLWRHCSRIPLLFHLGDSRNGGMDEGSGAQAELWTAPPPPPPTLTNLLVSSQRIIVEKPYTCLENTKTWLN